MQTAFDRSLIYFRENNFALTALMENNKSYLNKIPLVFLLIVGGLLLQELLLLLPLPAKEDNLRISYLANEIVNIFIFFVPLAMVFNKWTRAWWCIGASIAGALASTFMWEHYLRLEDDYAKGNIIYIGIQVLFLLINLFFFLDKKLSTRKIWLIIAALIIFRGASVVFYSTSAFFDLIRSYTSGYHKYMGMLVMLCFNIVKFIYLSELQNLADGKAPAWNIRLLNPGNTYQKLPSTIVFWAMKTFFYLLVFGLGYAVMHYSDPFRNISGRINPMFQIMSMFNSVFTIGVALMAAWWFRKFLIEYFAGHNITSKVSYWLLLLPVIGIITWIVLLQNEKTDSSTKRIDNINDFAASGTIGITTTYFILMGLLLFLNIVKSGSIGGAFSMFLAMLLFVWFIYERGAYYFNFYANVLLYASILLWYFNDSFRHSKEFALFYPLSVYNLVMLVLILPVYHFADFTYLIPEEPVASGVEDDVLAEFQ